MPAPQRRPRDASPRDARERSDEELISLASEGDEHAFGALYRRHAEYVAGIVFRLIGSDADVDDVVQLTFIEALRGLSRVEQAESFRGWLYRLSVCQVNRRLKKRWRADRLRAALEWIVPKRADLRDGFAERDLRVLLAKVAPEDRIAWLLHHVQGETLPETARLCETSLATVKRRIARAESAVGGEAHA
jgi:RNA polymerase sigma-70 factor (ECF subfamily)